MHTLTIKLLKISYVFLFALLAACGGGTGGSGASINNGAGSGTGAVAAQLEFSSSATQLNSSGASPATLTATAKSAGNVVIPGVIVTFTSNSGDLFVNNATTDDKGKSIATLNVGSNKANRTISVTATAGAISSTVTVDVKGTVLNVSGPTSVGLSTPITLLANLKDSAGSPISNTAISISSSLNNTNNKTCVPANCSTDSSGALSITYTPTVGGIDSISFDAMGATAIQSVSAATSLITITAAPDTGVVSTSEFGINQLGKVVTVVLNAPASAFPAIVNLSSTAGTVTPSTITLTGANIPNTTAVLATNSSVGSGVLLATHSVPQGVSGTFPFEIVSRTPANIALQASPSVIGSNVVGTATNKATITATVRDIVGNPVKGAVVNFTKPIDTSSGSLQSATAITDTAGLASTNYIAGPNAAAANTGVKINATVTGLSGVTATTNVTVAQQALYINMGFGNKLLVPNTTQYVKDVSVSVSDAAGQAVAGANISIALLPKTFYKGRMLQGNSKWVQGRVISYANPSATPPIPYVDSLDVVWCPNEDLNYNGTIQINGTQSEDTNGNGALDPGIRAIIQQVAGGATPGTTDATGFAFFKITYFKQDALWSEYVLTATSNTAGGGMQGNTAQSFFLPILAEDTNDINITPPNLISPFGQAYGVAPSCSNTQ